MNEIYKNKVVLVTGASRGIGKAIAYKFASQGAYVLGTATTEESAQKISNNFKKKKFLNFLTVQHFFVTTKFSELEVFQPCSISVSKTWFLLMSQKI